MVVIGPGGAVVVEVKHWDAAALRRNANVDHSAELITAKAKRVAGRLRAIDRRMEFVPGSMLFTRETNSLRRNGRQAEHLGIRIYALKDVSALLEIPARDGPCPSERLASTLAPRQMAGASVSPRRFARFDELKLLSPADDAFARVHSARDPANGDRVIIHSYDLSAAPRMELADLTLRRARREFDVVQRFQKSPYLPSMVDTWQPLPNYAGEVFFFTLADSAAASVEQLRGEVTWNLDDRLTFAVRALRALAELQTPEDPTGEPLIHRALNPASVRVRANGAPLFGGWRWARLPFGQTIAPGPAPDNAPRYTAPEVGANGLRSRRSSVRCICSLRSPDRAVRRGQSKGSSHPQCP